MFAKPRSHATLRKLARAAAFCAFAGSMISTTAGCLAYKVYSTVKTIDKVKDFTEDHILNKDDHDDDKDEHDSSSNNQNNH